MWKSKADRETPPRAGAAGQAPHPMISNAVRRASERASATSADIEALELSVLLRHGLVGTRRRHIPGLALAVLGRRAGLVLWDRRRALVLLRRRTRLLLSGQTLLDKGRKMNGTVLGDLDVGRGAPNPHGCNRSIDLHVAGFRHLSGDEGECPFGQADESRVRLAVRVVYEFVHLDAGVGGEIERGAVGENHADRGSGSGLNHIAPVDEVADLGWAEAAIRADVGLKDHAIRMVDRNRA